MAICCYSDFFSTFPESIWVEMVWLVQKDKENWAPLLESNRFRNYQCCRRKRYQRNTDNRCFWYGRGLFAQHVHETYWYTETIERFPSGGKEIGWRFGEMPWKCEKVWNSNSDSSTDSLSVIFHQLRAIQSISWCLKIILNSISGLQQCI